MDETVEEAPNLGSKENKRLAAQWLEEIEAYEQDAESWREQTKNIVARYKDERRLKSDNSNQKYNMFWANVQVLQPALYAQDPIPKCDRRFKQKDPVARVVADMVEKCLSYHIECTRFGDKVRQALFDRLMGGRGTSWVRYCPQIKSEAVEVTDDQQEPQTVESVVYEEAIPDYVHWEDFGHTWARTWDEVRAVWRIAHMSRQELVDRFGEEVGGSVPMTKTEQKPKDATAAMNMNVASQKKACVYEIWDKATKRVMWLNKDMDTLLDLRDDPLELEGFFPCPKPLFATLANDSLQPVPDYCFYQDQAREIDMLTERMALVLSAIRAAGAYDASAPGLARLFSEKAENVLVPVDSWAAFAERGGVQGAISMVPIGELANVYQILSQARNERKNDVYEITGLSDIIRGQSKASESATAQNLKDKYGSLRLSDSQKDIQRFCRDMLFLMADIIASKFSRETLSLMSGIKLLTMQEKQMLMMEAQQQPLPPEVAAMLNRPTWDEVEPLLRNDKLRSFRIDIETDSTVAVSKQAMQEEMTELMQGLGFLLQGVTPAVQSGVISQEAGKELMLTGLRKFRLGRDVEEAMEETQPQPSESAMQQKIMEAQQKLQQQEMQIQQAAGQVQQDAAALEAERKVFEAEQKAAEAEAKAAVTQIKSVADSFMQQIQVPAQVAKEKGDANAMSTLTQMAQQMQVIAQQAVQALAAASAPKRGTIVRDPVTGIAQSIIQQPMQPGVQ